MAKPRSSLPDVTKSADEVKALVDGRRAAPRPARRDGQQRRLDAPQPALPWRSAKKNSTSCYAVNVKSIYLATVHATPACSAANHGGSFINIASTAGVRPPPGPDLVQRLQGRGDHHQSKSLAAELGPDNIRVNCLNPVFNPDTGLSDRVRGRTADRRAQGQVLVEHPAGPLLDRARRGQRGLVPGQRRGGVHQRRVHRGRWRALRLGHRQT